MITKKTKYALRVLETLAGKERNEPQLIADLSAESAVPKKFLELILLELKGGGIVQSKKGPGGGYYLAVAPEEVRVADVMRLTGGAIAPVGCLSRTRYERCEECPDEKTCCVRLVLREAHSASVAVLERTRLSDLLRYVREAHLAEETAPMWYI